MNIQEIINIVNSPKVKLTYHEFGYTNVEFNDFNITEEFSEHYDFITHLKNLINQFKKELNSVKNLEYIKSLKKLFNNVLERFSFIEKPSDQRLGNLSNFKIYYHDNIEYIEKGVRKYFKKKDSNWVNFNTDELSFYIRELNFFLNDILSIIELKLSKSPHKLVISNPTVLFTEDTTKILIKGLKDFLNNEDYNKLKKIVKGQSITDKIYFKSNANKLADVFLRLHQNGKIIGTKIQTQKWLLLYFDYKNKDGNKAPLDALNIKKIIEVKYATDKLCKNPIPFFKEKFPYNF